MMFSLTFCACVSAVTLPYVLCQADLEHSYTPDKMPLQDKALFLADSLVENPVFFRKLLKIGESAQSFLTIGGDDPKFSFLLDVLMDKFPDILRSQDTTTILTILADELHRVDVNDTLQKVQDKHLQPNSTEYQQMMAGDIMERFNTSRAVQRILTRRSVRDYFPLTGNNIDVRCYNDVVDFVDAVHGLQYPPRQDFNYSSVPWALKMLDSYGKPPSGIMEGDLDWEGSVEECRKVHAHLNPGVILGNRTLTSPVNFHGRYCRIVFNITAASLISLIDSNNVDSIMQGICVPDTCASQDVKNILKMGVLKNLQLEPESVTCYDKNDHINQKTSQTSPHSPSSSFSSSNIVMSARDKVFTSCVGDVAGLSQDKWEHCFFSTFDIDKSFGISKNEWKSEYIKLGLDKPNSVDSFFLMLDTDKNLKIDATDLKYFFHFFDDNNDGLISYQEYSTNWSSLFL